MLAQHFHWRNVVLELGYGALAYLVAMHLAVPQLFPIVPPASQHVVLFALVLGMPLLVNTWRYIAWVKRGGHLASAFAVTLNWVGYVIGFTISFLNTQLPLLLGG